MYVLYNNVSFLLYPAPGDSKNAAVPTRSLVLLDTSMLHVVGCIPLGDFGQGAKLIAPVASKDELYIADRNNARIVVWNKERVIAQALQILSEGNSVDACSYVGSLMVRDFGSKGGQLGQFNTPLESLVLSADEEWLLVLDAGRITRFTKKGILLQVLPMVDWSPRNMSLGRGPSAGSVFVLCDNGPSSLNVYGEADESVHVLTLKEPSDIPPLTAVLPRMQAGGASWQVGCASR
jgi:hypothetical protein